MRRTHRRTRGPTLGAPLHIDALSLAKFDRPGHWATGSDALAELRRQAAREPGTIVYTARDEQHNSAVVLAELLRDG